MTVTHIQTELLNEAGEVLEFDILPYDDTDDGKDHKTHIVRPTDNPHLNVDVLATGQDVVDMARLLGSAIYALCGFKFVPKRNPEKYDACQDCVRIAGAIIRSNQ